MSAMQKRIMDYYTYISSPQLRDNPARLAELKAAGSRCRTGTRRIADPITQGIEPS
jgi:hypothetical protein